MLIDITQFPHFTTLDHGEKMAVLKAIHHYEFVAEHNISAKYEALSERGRKEALIKAAGKSFATRRKWLRAYESNSPKVWHEAMYRREALNAGGASVHSALFMRLIDGRMPTRYPPPASMGQPNYSLIESKQPQLVTSLMFPRGATKPNRLLIDGVDYAIQSANQAGHGLLSIAWEVHQSTTLNTPPKSTAAEIVQRTIAAYREQPEILVQYDAWPAWALKPGTTQPRQAGRGALDDRLRMGSRISALASAPLSLSFADLNLRACEHHEAERTGARPTPTDHATQRLKFRLTQILAGLPPKSEFSDTFAEPEKKDLGPSTGYTTTQWHMSHTPAWNALTKDDIYIDISQDAAWAAAAAQLVASRQQFEKINALASMRARMKPLHA